MEPDAGNVVKAKVVYYLSRNGKMEPPHMIEVPYMSNEGLRLIDVKRRLTVLRGSAMGNMFSWSYKRSYKNIKYIWLDLSAEDVIIPGHSGEYVLKGSELFENCQDKMMKHVSNQESDTRKHPEVLQNKYRGAETWMKHDNSDHCAPNYLKHEVNESCSGFSQGNLNTVRINSHNMSFPADSMQTLRRQGIYSLSAPDDFVIDNKISTSSELSDSSTQTMTEIKILPIKSTIVPARHGCDAATQTNFENDLYYEDISKKDSVISGSSRPWKVFDNEHYYELNHNQAEASLLSTISGELSAISGELTSDQNMNHTKKHCKVVKSSQLPEKDPSANVRLKHTTASRVFLQILSCGGVDTKVQKEIADADSEGAHAAEKKVLPREQLLRSQSPPSNKVARKPVTPRGHRTLESVDSRTATPTAYSCEFVDLDYGQNNESFVHTSMPRASEVEQILTAFPSPSNEAELSKLLSRCSSSSSRRSTRSIDFEIQQEKKIKEIGTTFGTPCKSPGGSPVLSGFYKSANASRAISPIRLPSSDGDRQRWGAANLSQKLYSAHDVVENDACPAERFQIPAQSKWKDLTPLIRETRLQKVKEKH